MAFEIRSTAERPDLAEVAGLWRFEHFRRAGALDDALAAERAAAASGGPLPLVLVLLVDGAPVGMASLVESDLPERPDLTPWLAGVYVVPAARGAGWATRLVGAAEEAARAASIGTLWLYTRTAESLYARAGWRTVERFARAGGRAYALMRRDLPAAPPAQPEPAR